MLAESGQERSSTQYAAAARLQIKQPQLTSQTKNELVSSHTL